MKSILLSCAAVLGLVGCASESQISYPGYRDLGFSSDMIPAPVTGLTVADAERVYGPTAGSTSSAYSDNRDLAGTPPR
jgi:hypothetical protein